MPDIHRAPPADASEGPAASPCADAPALDDRAGGGLVGANAAAPRPPEQGATPSNLASPAVAGDAGAVKAQAAATRATPSPSDGAAGRE